MCIYIYIYTHTHTHTEGFPCGSAGKESACNAGDLDSVPGLGRSPGEGRGYPLQYSGLGIPWTVQSRTRLKDFHFTSSHMCADTHTFLWCTVTVHTHCGPQQASGMPTGALTVLTSIIKDRNVGCGPFPGNLHCFPQIVRIIPTPYYYSMKSPSP